MPADIPVTIPEVGDMVAIDVLLLNQVPILALVNVVVEPEQIETEPPIADGIGFAITVVVYIIDGLHPGNPLPFVTVREYTVVTVGVAIGFWAVVEANPGPLQLYSFAPPNGFANRFTVLPAQIGPLFVGTAKGNEFTITVEV